MIGIAEAAAFLFLILTARWQLKPLRERAASAFQPVQFQLSDILLLMVMLGLSGSVFAQLPDREVRTTVIAVLWLGLVLSWVSAVRLLSRAGVQTLARRAVIEAVALPLVIFGPLLLVLLPATVSFERMYFQTPEKSYSAAYVYVLGQKSRIPDGHYDLARYLWFVFWGVTLLAWLFIPRRLMRWALRSPVPPRPSPPAGSVANNSDAPPLDPHVKDLNLK